MLKSLLAISPQEMPSAQNKSALESPNLATTAVLKRNKALGALYDASTMGSGGSYANQVTDDSHVLKEDLTATNDKLSLADKRKVTVPLSLIFFLECALIIAALVIIVAVSQERMTSSYKDIIRTNIQSFLAYASTEVTGPITNLEHVLVDLRTRTIVEEALNFGYKPCSDYSHEIRYSSRLLSDLYSIVQSHPTINILYTIRPSNMNFDSVTGAPLLSQCAATLTNVRTVTNGDNQVSLGPLITTNFYKLEEVPTARMPDSYLNLAAAELTLEFATITWVPAAVFDSLTNTTVLTLSGNLPSKVNRTNTLTGISDVYTPAAGEITQPSHTYKVLDAIGASVNMDNFNFIMKSITMNDPDAHASLYDVLSGTLLCTSMPGFPQFDPNNQMWPAGNTPSSSLNDAFIAIDTRTLAVGTPRILFQKKTIVSGTLVTTEFGILFAIVRSTPRRYYFGTIDSVRNMMIIIGVLAVFLTVGTAISIAVSIQSGVRKVKDNMEIAAALKNERVVPSYSLISEINHLCIAFDRMNDKLMVARAYLPQHLLVSTDDSAEDDEGESGHVEDATSATALNRSRHSESVKSIAASQVSPTLGPVPAPTALLTFDGVNFVEAENSIPANLASKDTRKEAISRLPPADANGLSTKRVTILSVNARGFHTSINVFAPNTAIEPTMDLTDTISQICNRERGVIDSFHGDHFVLSFNAARHNAEGPQKAARCAMDIIAAHEGLLEFSMGLSTGKACVGHLGTATLKRLSIIGEVYSRAMANERLCRQCFSSSNVGLSMIRRADGEVTLSSNAIQCVADGIIAAEIQHTCLLQLLGVQPPSPAEIAHAAETNNSNMVTNLTPPAPLRAEKLLYGVRGSIKKGGAKDGDEWLYEINHNNSPVLSLINAAMLAYLTATYATAPSECIGDTTEAQKQLNNEIMAICRAGVRKPSGISNVAVSKLPHTSYAENSDVQQEDARPATLTREEAIGQSAIKYATAIASARPWARIAAGVIGV